MADHVCPWWMGYILASPLRKLSQNPEKILGPYVKEGMTVLDVGAGMGFFSIPMARLVGESGRVIAVDMQDRMLKGLESRARKAGLSQRIQLHLCRSDSLDLTDMADFCLAFGVVHELPNATSFLAEVRAVLKPGGKLLLAEPRFHVSEKDFQDSVKLAFEAGFTVAETPVIRWSRAVVLQR